MDLERFIALWMHPEYPPRPISEDGLRSVEAHFGFTFPSDYRRDVLRWGLVSPTSALLDAIVDRELDLPDLSRLKDPTEMVASTEAWREMGLPHGLVAFASDCAGNLFCFDATRSASSEAPVIYFDHDFGTTRAVAPSFSAWIEAYCAIDPDPGSCLGG
jgi:cell wall assembly regulator SMI1